MEAQAARMGLNMQESFRSRFLHVAIPRSYYTKGKDAWDTIGRCIGEAYRKLATDGFAYRGRQWHAVCLGLTGDNPFLAKVGHLERSFSHVAKQTGTAAGKGICWLCHAGMRGTPFENLNLHPEWCHTEFETLPWKDPPPFLEALAFQLMIPVLRKTSCRISGTIFMAALENMSWHPQLLRFLGLCQAHRWMES